MTLRPARPGSPGGSPAGQEPARLPAPSARIGSTGIGVARKRARRLALAGLVAGGLGLGLGALAVRAAPDGWSLTAAVSEDLRVLTNPDLDPDEGDEVSLRATTRLGATLTRRSRTATLTLDGSLSPVLAEDMPDTALGILAPALGGRLAVQGRRVALTARVNGRITPTQFTDQLFGLDDQGAIDPTTATLVTGTALQASLAASAGLSWTATRRDTLGFDLGASRVDFFEGNTTLVPATSLDATASWSRRLTPSLDGSFSAGLGWFEAESVENPQSVTFDSTAGLAWQVNARLRLTGGLGFTLARTEQIDTALPGNPRVSDTAFGLTGNLGLTWAGPDDSLALNVSQGVQPSTLGSLQNTTRLTLSYAHQLNSLTSLGIDGRVQLQTPISAPPGTSDRTLALRIGPYLNYQFDADTALRLGYTLDLSDDEQAGTAISHGVFLSLNRGFNLLQ